MKRGILVLGVALVAAAVIACERDEPADEGVEADTVGVSIDGETRRELEQAGERARDAAREAGGAVGRALEETGEAVEKAGERMQRQSEAVGEDDTTGSR